MKDYRDKFALGDYQSASKILDGSELKTDKKSVLLWHLENGTLSLSQNDFDGAIANFQQAIELIDKLYTTKLSSKAASLFINDASDEFYGASYERSYAHYFLSKAYYQKFLRTGNKLDLQGARGTILAWDTYFSDLQRSGNNSLYNTDLMLKVFGAQVHEVSEIRNDQQIALQLYKDALVILNGQGGIYSLFNKKNIEYIKSYEAEKIQPNESLYERTEAYEDLKDFIHFKILSLTHEIRNFDFDNQAKSLAAKDDIIKKSKLPKSNVTLVIEEGLIPPKIAKPFSIGLRGAMNSVSDNGAKNFIATVGVEAVTAFAMNKLGMIPNENTDAGSFIFAHDVTRLTVQEAAIEFELPMVENVPSVQRMQLFVVDEKGSTLLQEPLPVVNENGDLARVVLEEDIVSRYIKTGTRVAVRHLVAIVTAMGVYQRFQGQNQENDFLAKSAALATYLGASKGLSLLERADTRHWTTLPQALRMAEVLLPPGKYKVGVAAYNGAEAPKAPTKFLGDIEVKNSDKSLYTLRYNQLN